MSNETKDLSVVELAALVQQLQKRVDGLESTVAGLVATRPVPEEDLAVLAAAAAAYMGYKGKVKAVRYSSRTGWTSAARRSLTDNRVRGTMPAPAL